MTEFSKVSQALDAIIAAGGDPSTLESRVLKLEEKGREQDPLKQTLGPKMRDKVLVLVERFHEYKKSRILSMPPAPHVVPPPPYTHPQNVPSTSSSSAPAPVLVHTSVPVPMDISPNHTSPELAPLPPLALHLSPMDALMQCVEQVFALHGLRPPVGTYFSSSTPAPPTVFSSASHSTTVTFLPVGKWLLVYAGERNVKLSTADDDPMKVKTKVAAHLIYPVLYCQHVPSIRIFPPEVHVTLAHFLDLRSLGRLEVCAAQYAVHDMAFSHICEHLDLYSDKVLQDGGRRGTDSAQTVVSNGVQNEPRPLRMACRRLVLAAVERLEMTRRVNQDMTRPRMPFNFPPLMDPRFIGPRDGRPNVIGGPRDLFPGGDFNLFPRQPRGGGGFWG